MSEPDPTPSALTTQPEPKLPDLTKYGFEFSIHGLKPIGAPNRHQCFNAFNQLKSYGGWLQVRGRAWQLAMGDLWNYCRDRFGEDAFQITDQLDYERGTLYQWGRVAREIPARTRVQIPLDYSYYREVSGCNTQEERESWLKLAAAEHFTVKDLQREMHKAGAKPHVVKTAVALLPGNWLERSDHLLSRNGSDDARAVAETYKRCAKELTEAMQQDSYPQSHAARTFEEQPSRALVIGKDDSEP